MSWQLIANVRGAPGAPGGTQYTHFQYSAASSWTVLHNLGYYPHITIIMDDGTVVVADVDHLSTNSALITFPTPYTGKAVCS